MNQLANYAGVDATSFTQELRLSGSTDATRWVGGLYYLNIDNDSDNGLKAPVGSIVGTFVAPVDIGTKAHLKTNSYSLFGQLEYDFTDTLTGILGARVIKEKKDFNTAIGVFPSLGNFSVNQGNFLPSPFGEGSPLLYQPQQLGHAVGRQGAARLARHRSTARLRGRESRREGGQLQRTLARRVSRLGRRRLPALRSGNAHCL